MSSTMTISQGLRRIKKLKGRMGELTARAAESVSYEAGKKPVFDFKATRESLGKVREELVLLEAAVARANAVTAIKADGQEMTIAEAIRRLQELKAEMSWLQHLTLREGTVRERDPEKDTYDEYRRCVPHYRDVTFVSDVSVVARVAELEALQERFDRINDAVETANHKTPLELPELVSGKPK